MNKIILWIGVIALVVGIVLFAYGFSTIQNIKDNAGIFGVSYYLSRYPDQQLPWDLAQIFQPLGIGLSVLGAIMMAYGLLVKKESK